MSAKIYGGIEGIEEPKLDFKNYNAKDWQEKCEKFYDELKKACKEQSSTPDDKDVGEIINFPVADGKASYMVFSMKPLELIHINVGDGYQEEMAELLTVKKTRELVKRERALKEIFGKKK